MLFFSGIGVIIIISNYEIKNKVNDVNKITVSIVDLLENHYEEFASKDLHQLLTNVNFKRVKGLTKTLRLWTDKEKLNEGEIVLAYANLGSLVESWLKLFLVIYVRNYDICTLCILREEAFDSNYKYRVKSPDKLKFIDLNKIARRTFLNKNEELQEFTENVRIKRNAIHSFRVSEYNLGEIKDFNDNIYLFHGFLEEINNHFPLIKIR